MSAFTGLIGVALIFITAFLMSNNRRAIDWRLVICGFSFQIILALFILKLPLGKELFHQIGQGVEQLLAFSDEGAGFLFGALVREPEKMRELFGPGGDFIFAFKLIPTIVFVSALVSIGYHFGIIQQAVRVIAWIVYKIMGASGAEALSNAASAFVGQVEAQLLVKPYLSKMTQSELLAVMSGSLACIAGGAMAVYIQMGVPTEYLLTASLMAIPGALVISKIVLPETEHSVTRGTIQMTVEKNSVNFIDAAAHGAGAGMKIGISVCAMIIAFIAGIAMINFAFGQIGLLLHGWGISLAWLGLDVTNLSLTSILGSLSSWVALALGVPAQDIQTAGSLMGTKLVVNEFVAYATMSPMLVAGNLDPKTVAIVSFALCGFANFGSIGIIIGGVGEMAPERKHDLARLGMRALVCGTMASYLSAAIAGILFSAPQTSDFGYLGLMGVATIVIILTNRYWGEKQIPNQANQNQQHIFKRLQEKALEKDPSDEKPLQPV